MKNQEIQVLRGIACLFVLGYHIVIAIPNIQMYYKNICSIFMCGNLGVDLFFSISGFFAVKSLYRHEETIVGIKMIKKFLGRRLKRIIPPSIFWVTFQTVLVVFFPWAGSLYSTISHGLACLLQIANFYLFYHAEDPDKLGNFGYFWTLSLEFQFCVIIALLGFCLSRKILKYLYLTMGVIFSVLRCGVVIENLGIDYRLLSFRMDGLFLGAAISLFLMDGNLKRIKNYYICHRMASAMVAFVFHLILWTGGGVIFNIDAIGKYMMYGIISTGLVLFALPDLGISVPLVSGICKKVLEMIGNKSYSIYLGHMIIIMFLQSFLTVKFGVMWNNKYIFVLYVPVLILIVFSLCSISDLLFEKNKRGNE